MIAPNKKAEDFDIAANGVTGFGTFRYDKGYAVIAYMKVDQAKRRQGIGRNAVAEVEERAQDRGLREVRGEALEGSEAFWSAMGYALTAKASGGRQQIRKAL